MRNPSQFFYGVTVSGFRAHCEAVWKALKPHALHVPCVGRFTEVCSFIAAGADPHVISTSDVSLLSSVIGELAAGRSVSRMPIDLTAAEPFRQHADDEVELGAAVLIAAKLADMPGHTLHAASLRRHAVETSYHQVKDVAAHLRPLVDTLHGISYRQADIRDEVASYVNLGEEELVMLAMPRVAGDYAKMLGRGERLFGWRGVEAMAVEETTRREAHAALLKAPPVILSLCQFEHEETAPGWHVVAAVSDRPKRIDYLVANRRTMRRRSIPKRAYSRHRQAPKHRRLPLYDGHELTEEAAVHMETLDEPTALHYRGVFVHRLGTTRARSYYGAFVDGQLFGVAGFNADKVQMGLSTQLFEMFGVCTHSTYSRLSLLLNALYISRETRDLFYTTMGGLVGHEFDSIGSQSFMQYAEGKTEHRGHEIVSRTRRPDGTWEIYYRSKFTELDWRETYLEWLLKHARKRRAA